MSSTELNYEISLDVEYDIAINKNDIEDQKALLNAAIKGNSEKIEQLLKSGVCVDAKEYNKLLFYASKNYFTPLQLATLNNHDKCVQLLIDYGADVNAKDLFGLTTLHLAACNNSYNILKILLRAKADCSVPIKFSYSIPLKYSATAGHFKIPHLGGTTPLHLAAATNSIDCVKELIRYGADFNAVDEDGRTSLYVAAQLGYSECVLVHLKEAVGRDILSLPSFKTSDTPLHFAVRFHMLDCIKELLYLGSDVNHRNFDGLSPLHIALLPSNSNISDQLKILKLLVLEGYKTDINQPDWEGFTPLHYVCFYGHRNMWCRRPEIAKFLIAYGADTNIKDFHKCSLLEKELKYPEENFTILKYLVKSFLYLPHLKSLNIDCRIGHFSNQLQSSILRNQLLDQRIVDPSQFFVEPNNAGMQRNGVPFNIGIPGIILSRDQLVERAMEFPYHQRPFVMDVLMEMYENDIRVYENLDASNASSFILKKHLWYEQLASSPRTLQHHCRFLIRKVLGPMKLKYIKKLPIPSVLQSYLLFELDK